MRSQQNPNPISMPSTKETPSNRSGESTPNPGGRMPKIHRSAGAEISTRKERGGMKDHDMMMDRPTQTSEFDLILQGAAVPLTFDIDEIVRRWFFEPDPKRQDHGMDNGSRKARPNRRLKAESAQTSGQPNEGL